MAGLWQSLGGLRAVVQEGLQEFGQDALRETGLVKAAKGGEGGGHSGSGRGIGVKSRNEDSGKGREQEQPHRWERGTANDTFKGDEDEEEEAYYDDAEEEEEGGWDDTDPELDETGDDVPDLGPTGEDVTDSGETGEAVTALEAPQPQVSDFELPEDGASNSEAGRVRADSKSLPLPSGPIETHAPGSDAGEASSGVPPVHPDAVRPTTGTASVEEETASSSSPFQLRDVSQEGTSKVEEQDGGGGEAAVAGGTSGVPKLEAGDLPGASLLVAQISDVKAAVLDVTEEGAVSAGEVRPRVAGEARPVSAGHVQQVVKLFDEIVGGGQSADLRKDVEGGDKVEDVKDVPKEQVNSLRLQAPAVGGRSGAPAKLRSAEEGRSGVSGSGAAEGMSIAAQVGGDREEVTVKEGQEGISRTNAESEGKLRAQLEELKREKAEVERDLQRQRKEAEEGMLRAENEWKKELAYQKSASAKAGQEVERLQVLLKELQSSMDASTKERTQMTKTLEKLEDELEEERAKNKSLEAEISEMEVGADEEIQEVEDRAEKAEKENKQLQKRVEALEALERKKDIKILNLQADVQTYKEEKQVATKGLEEAKKLLKEAMEERTALEEALAEREAALDQSEGERSTLEEELESARRDAAESSVKLAEALAELRDQRRAAEEMAVEEGDKALLSSQLTEMRASAKAAAEEAEQHKQRIEVLEREAKGAVQAAKAMEAELALAQQRVLEAEAESADAKKKRAQAEGTTEQLREDTERRAKLFNAAVKAAVTKIQTELEDERDAALERVKELEDAATAHVDQLIMLQSQLGEMETSLDAAYAEMQGKQLEMDTMQQDLNRAQNNVKGLREELEDGKRREMELQETKWALEKKLEQAEGSVFELQASAEELQRERQEETERGLKMFQREKLLLQQQLDQAEAEKTSLQVSALGASEKAAEEASKLQKEAERLKMKVQSLEIQNQSLQTKQASLAKSSSSQDISLTSLPGGERERDKVPSAYHRQGSTESMAAAGKAAMKGRNPLEDLGLESVQWKDKLRQDVEAGVVEGSWKKFGMRSRASPASTSSSPFTISGAGPLSRAAEGRSGGVGQVSTRFVILVTYIVLLHLVVMVAFTHRSAPGCPDLKDLPGR